MKKRLTYHWMIVLACFLMMAVSIGMGVNCFNLFAVELMAEFNFTAGSVQIIMMVAVLVSVVGAVLVGKLLAKFPMRPVLTVSAVITIAGFVLYSRCNSLLTFCLASAVTGIGSAGIGIVPCGSLLNIWFVDKKGLATGIGFSGSVVGGLVFVQIVNAVIASSGWRTAYVALAGIAAVLLLPTTLFIVRAHPNQKGLSPLGAELAAGQQMKPLGISVSKYIKTGSFWLLAVSAFTISFINIGIQNNISIYFTKVLGKDMGFAANIFSLVMLVQIFGKILLGAIYDKKGIRFGAVYCTVMYLIAVIAIMWATNLVIAIVFAVFFGLVSAMNTITPPYVTARIVGVRDYPTIFGLLSIFTGIGMAVGPIVAGQVFDATGSFNGALYVFMGLALILTLIISLASKKGEGFSVMDENSAVT